MYNEITYQEKEVLNAIIQELEMADKNKGGRPTVENRRVIQTIRLLPNLKEWVNSQDESAGVYIEGLIMRHMEQQQIESTEKQFELDLKKYKSEKAKKSC